MQRVNLGSNDALAADAKCVAVDKAGPDYSYYVFVARHGKNQQELLSRFVKTASLHSPSIILHICAENDKTFCGYVATEDAIAVLRGKTSNCDAVFHCFG